ncbi:MAG: ABC transporter permease [SAR324 cluster bacterium]|nr:ABC transporter permease [SAR324 cluster bacterium]
MTFFKNTNVYKFISYLITYHGLIGAMALHEIKSRYIGSLGGVFWLVIHPLVMVSIYWLVFSFGFKVHPQGEVPFILFFLCGLTPWLTFQETLSNAAESIVRAPHLVKQVSFPLGALPMVSLLVGLVSQVVMILILLSGMLFYDMPWAWSFLNVFYYLFALMFFVLGLGWIVSSVNVFFRDVSQILTVGLGLWFWLTPVVWPPELFPADLLCWLKIFNPMYYVVEGYRESFLYGVPFWESSNNHFAFWIISGPLFFFGAVLFKRMRADFVEVI